MKKQNVMEPTRTELSEQYKVLVDKSSIVSKTDTQGIITYVNDNFCQVSGYKKEELIGKPHNIVRHPKMSSSVFQEVWHTIRDKKNIWQGVIRNRKKDGGSYYVETTIMPILDQSGKIVEYIALRQDITALIKTEKKLKDKTKEIKQERKKLKSILNHVDNIVAMSKRGEKLVFANKKFFEVFEYKNLKHFRLSYDCVCKLFIAREGYLQEKMNGVMWTDYVQKYPSIQHKALLKDKNGIERTYKVDVQPTIETNPSIFVITLSDITELERVRKQAEESAKAKGEFLANMSHEIRTPMNGILGFTKLLTKSDLNEKQQHYLKIIDGSAQTLLGIINDILDISKLESGKFELDLTDINPFVEFERAAMLFMAQMSEKQIAFEIDIDPNLSECIHVDILRLQQVTSNLLGNALKFTPPHGKIVFYVKVNEAFPDEQILEIGVKDNGIGISEEKQKYIFEAFSQADTSTTRKYGGTGLGLSISSHLVGLMGGKLRLNSKEGIGSRFFFEVRVKSCVPEYRLDTLFEGVSVTMVCSTENPSRTFEIIKKYFKKLKIAYSQIEREKLGGDILYSDEIFFVPCEMDESLMKKLSRNNTVIMVEEEGTKIDHKIDRVIYVESPEHNFSMIYNILLNHGQNLLAQKCKVAPVDPHAEKIFHGKVMVAEDNVVNQLLIQELLSEYGIKPKIVENGSKALLHALKENFDLIFMDNNMPVMGGVEAMKKIKKEGIVTPIVALTANAMEGDKERLLAEGFDGYLSKPVIIDELERLLKLHLKRTDISEKSMMLTTNNVIDIERLKKTLPVSEEVLKKLFEKFFQSISEILGSLREAIENKDYENIVFCTHSLYGAAGSLFLDEIAALAREMEKSAIDKKPVDYKAQLLYIEEMIEVVKKEFAKI